MTENVINTFSRKLHSLSDDSLQKPTLLELKSLVMNAEKEQLAEIARLCSLNSVFDCLNSADGEQIENGCIIIYDVLKNMNAEDCLAVYSKFLQRALGHPSSYIKYTFLKLLNNVSSNGTVALLNNEYPELLIEACDCIGSPERYVAQGAIDLFTNIGVQPEGLSILFSKLILEKFRDVMLINDVARFRVFEIISSVSQKSDEGLQYCINSGLLNLLLEEVKSADTLLQLNALEILSSLGSCTHGFKFLQESGIIQYLADKILKLEDEPLSYVLLPGLIEFFGNICKVEPQVFMSDYLEVVNLLFRSLETTDEVLLGVIYSTVGKIGSTTEGKFALNSQPQQMEYFLKRAGQLLNNKNDTTVNVMHSLTELFTTDEMNEGLSAMLLEWFEDLGSGALENIINLTKLPFIELRLSALTLLNAISKQQWGASKLCKYPGMIEYLTDRATEFHKDCKSAKYEIICSIVQAPNISNLVSDEIKDKLNEYVQEGPYFVPTLSPEMMTEGAS